MFSMVSPRLRDRTIKSSRLLKEESAVKAIQHDKLCLGIKCVLNPSYGNAPELLV